MRAAAALKAPSPPKVDHHQEDEEPLPPCLVQERAVAEASDASVAASSAYDVLLLQQKNLEQELQAASKGDAARLQAELAELEPELLLLGQVAKDARQQVKTAQRRLEKEHQLVFARIQAGRCAQQARQLAVVYATLRRESSRTLTRGNLALLEERREKHRSKVEAAKALAYTNAVMHFNTTLYDREQAWRNSWEGGRARPPGKHPAFPPVGRPPLSKWVPPSQREGNKGSQEIELLKQQLGRSLARIKELFKKWDVDSDGEVSIVEFRQALAALQIKYEEGSLTDLFAQLDTDRSGTIDFNELNQVLGNHAPDPPPPDEISLEVPARREPKQEITGAERRAVAALKEKLQGNLSKVTHMFADWDTDGNGLISPKEMQRAMASLCIPIDKRALTLIFSEVDNDNSGEIDYHELNSMLRREMSVVGNVVEATLVDPTKTSQSQSQRVRAGSAPVSANASVRSLRRPQSTTGLPRRELGPNNGQPKREESARIAWQRKKQGYSASGMRELLHARDGTQTGLGRSGTQPAL